MCSASIHWVGLLPLGDATTAARRNCRITPGRVVDVEGETATVEAQPLKWDGRTLRLGAPGSRVGRPERRDGAWASSTNSGRRPVSLPRTGSVIADSAKHCDRSDRLHATRHARARESRIGPGCPSLARNPLFPASEGEFADAACPRRRDDLPRWPSSGVIGWPQETNIELAAAWRDRGIPADLVNPAVATCLLGPGDVAVGQLDVRRRRRRLGLEVLSELAYRGVPCAQPCRRRSCGPTTSSSLPPTWSAQASAIHAVSLGQGSRAADGAAVRPRPRFGGWGRDVFRCGLARNSSWCSQPWRTGHGSSTTVRSSRAHAGRRPRPPTGRCGWTGRRSVGASPRAGRVADEHGARGPAGNQSSVPEASRLGLAAAAASRPTSSASTCYRWTAASSCSS